MTRHAPRPTPIASAGHAECCIRCDSARFEGVQIAAKVVLDQGLDEQVGVLVLVAGADRADDRRQLHDRGLHRGAITALPGDQDVMGNFP
jgi:hypothetical protein